MAIILIDLDHFFGARNLTPDPVTSARDLSRIVREAQTAINTNASGVSTIEGKLAKTLHVHVAIDDGDSPYAADMDVANLIGVDTTSAAVTVTLPDPALVEVGAELVIKDEGGNATANVITLTGTVDGAVNPTISTDYDKQTLYSNGTAWFSK